MKYFQGLNQIHTIKTFFCSLLTTKKSEDADWMRAYKQLLSLQDRAERFILFDRSRMNDSYLTHMEFGIGMDDDDQIAYFGDICCSTPEIRNTPKTSCCCSLFSFKEIDDLSTLKDIGNNVLSREMENH